MFLQMPLHIERFEFVQFDTAEDASDINVRICMFSPSHKYETAVYANIMQIFILSI